MPLEGLERTQKRIMDDSDKENPDVVPEGKNGENVLRASQHDRPTTSQGRASNPKGDVPRTPAGRLALPDLIGMVDFRTVEEETSPDERVIWEHDKDALCSSAPSYITPKRRKRARSSSPHSSPNPLASSHFQATRPAKDPQKTPQADPGLELWDRLGLNSNRPTPKGVSLPALAHIMQTSSPQHSNGDLRPRSIATLRRAITCGSQWPKRRRLEDTIEDNDDLVTGSENAASSRVNVVKGLLERTHEGRAVNPVSNGPSSSSPIPDRHTISNYHDISPLRGKQAASMATIPKSRSSRRLSTPIKIESDGDDELIPELMAKANSPSDYGDFDDDEFDEVLEATTSTQVHLSKDPSSPLGAMSAIPENMPSASKGASETNTTVSVSQMVPTPITEPDEFGDSDDEIFDDMLTMVAKFDKTDTETKMEEKVAATARTNPKKLPAIDSDDEFGDDVDDEDFAVAEATATQSIYSGSIQPVRTRPP